MTVLFAAFIGVLSAFLHTYEVNLPEKVAEKFVCELDKNALALLVEGSAGELCEFEDASLLIDRIEHLSGEIRQAKLAKEYTSAVPVYRLICGESDIGKLTLKRSEKDAAFGIARFEVDSAVLYDESVPGAIERTSVRVCVPAGASLTANGKAVGAEYMTESGVNYSGKTVTAAGTLCDIYVIENLCLLPELKAEFEGESSVLSLSGGNADWFSENERTFILTVPSDASVTIDGKSPKASLAAKGELTEAVSEFEKHLGDALPETVSYTVHGSKEDTEISVSVNGKSLEGQWLEAEKNENAVYLYSDESKFKIKATIPEGAVLYVNGVAASESYLSGKSPYEGLTAVKYLASDPEKLSGVLYEISGLLCEPSITAKLGEKELPLCSISRNEQTFIAEFYGKASENIEAVKNAADSFTRSYFHYVANGAVGIEENYNALIALMKSGSPGYKQIQRSKSSFEFVNQGVYRIDLISPKNFIPLGSNLIYCQVDFSVNLRFYRNEKQYEGTISLVFLNESGAYKVCDMVIDSDG